MTPVNNTKKQVTPVYIGIDNGVNNSTFGIICPSEGIYKLLKIPTKNSLNYQKTKEKWVTRINVPELELQLYPYSLKEYNTVVLLERPMINPLRFTASISGARALEAVLVVLENLNIRYEYIDSKTWQTKLFPTGTVNVKRVEGKSSKTSSDLKKLGIEIAKRKFPKVEIPSKCDADGILIAHYAELMKL